MIRINLHPGAKRKSASSGGTQLQAASPGQYIVLAMLAGWGVVCGAGYWLLTVEEDVRAEIAAETAKIQKEVAEIKKEIDEEALKAILERVEKLRTAIDKLRQERRSPVYVMHELANILTQGKMPDIDEETHRRQVSLDPKNALKPDWDATGVWLHAFKEAGGAIQITGAARDTSDLNEFMRRIRASSRFGEPSNATWGLVDPTRGVRYREWSNVTVPVTRWD